MRNQTSGALQPAHVSELIRDAGGRVVGRTRLQKIAYLMELAGVGAGFEFEYRHYGPYSEQLSTATRAAELLGLIHEDERLTSWGGFYSIFTTQLTDLPSEVEGRVELARRAVDADPVELELAATAAFLYAVGESDPWAETANRKPEKASPERMNNAKALYDELRHIRTVKPLPKI